jgi:hypothetical protein
VVLPCVIGAGTWLLFRPSGDVAQLQDLHEQAVGESRLASPDGSWPVQRLANGVNNSPAQPGNALSSRQGSPVDFDRLSASLHLLGPLKVRIAYKTDDDASRALADGLYSAFARAGWSPMLPQRRDLTSGGDPQGVVLSDRISPVLAHQLAQVLVSAGVPVDRNRRFTTTDANGIEIYVAAKGDVSRN